MKRISFLFFTLLALGACTSSVEPNEPSESSDSEIKKQPQPQQPTTQKLACADVGGECIGLHYLACQDGTWADANAVTCGGGLGVGCCVRPQPPPPPPPPPPPSSNACESKGGRCTGLTPTACPEGFFADATQFSCGPGIGAGCCWACPTLSPPAPSFCTGGTIVRNDVEAGCVRGYDCVK